MVTDAELAAGGRESVFMSAINVLASIAVAATKTLSSVDQATITGVASSAKIRTGTTDPRITGFDGTVDASIDIEGALSSINMRPIAEAAWPNSSFARSSSCTGPSASAGNAVAGRSNECVA